MFVTNSREFLEHTVMANLRDMATEGNKKERELAIEVMEEIEDYLKRKDGSAFYEWYFLNQKLQRDLMELSAMSNEGRTISDCIEKVASGWWDWFFSED